MKTFLTSLLMMLTASYAYAQDANPPAPAASQGEPISWLMFFTFAAVIIIAVGAFVSFARTRSGREAINKTHNPSHPSNR